MFSAGVFLLKLKFFCLYYISIDVLLWHKTDLIFKIIEDIFLVALNFFLLLKNMQTIRTYFAIIERNF